MASRFRPDLLRLKELLRSRVARDTAWAFALKATHMVLGFLITVALTRLLQAEGYGIYAYAYAIVLLLALPAQAGLPRLLVRETARGLAEGDLGSVRHVWGWSTRILGISTVLLVAVVGPLLVLWQSMIGETEGRTLAWALALIPLIAVGSLGGAALQGLQRITAGQLPEFVLRPGIFLVLIGGIGILGGTMVSADEAMMLHVGAALIAAIGSLVLVRWLTPVSLRGVAPRDTQTGLLKTSLVFALLAGFQVINAQADTVVLGLFEAPDQVGIYRVAVQVATLASLGLNLVNTVLGPRFADLYARGDLARLQQLVTAGARLGLGANVVLTLGFLLLGQSFLSTVFGEEFGASFFPMVILLAGQVVSSAVGSVATLLNMAGRERVTAKTMAVASAVNIALNILFIPIWGILGAATSTAVTLTLWNLLLVRRVRTDLGISSLAFRVGSL